MVQGGENTYQNDLNLVDYFIIRFHLKKLIFIILI